MNIQFKQAHKSNFKAGRPGGVEYIVVHYTGNDGDTSENNADYFANNANLKASAHYFVDEASVWQSVKEGDTAWHCGAVKYRHPKCRNENSIGVELCSCQDHGGYYFKDGTVANAQALIRELMAKYDVPLSNVLRHYDVTGKICPAPFVNKEGAWRAFLDALSSGEPESGRSVSITRLREMGYTGISF